MKELNKTDNKTTNFKANTIIDVITELIILKENGDLLDLQIKWDEKNNTLDITTVPKQEIKSIQCNFTITPTGVTFN